MKRSDDLAPSFNQQPPPAVGFRQGTIIAWNPISAQNTIEVGGALLTDVPILNTAEAGILTPGDVVGLITTGEGAKSFAIIGRLTIPNTPQAGSALSAWAARGKLATVAAFINTASATYVSASGGPDIVGFNVGVSGQALVFISAYLTINGGTVAGFGSNRGYMSFDLSGPTLLGPDDTRALALGHAWTVSGTTNISLGSTGVASIMVPLSGLTPGTYALSARYRADGGIAQDFGFRSLFAVPI